MRRVWFALDSGFAADPKVEALGVRFGPGGPFALIVMMGAAKIQGDEGGRFTLPWAGLKSGAYLKSERQAKEIVHHAATLEGVSITSDGDFPLIELIDVSARGFVARFYGWDGWQRKSNADRQQRYRERRRQAEEAAGQSDVENSLESATRYVTRDVTTETETEQGQQGTNLSVVSPIRSAAETFVDLHDETDRGVA